MSHKSTPTGSLYGQILRELRAAGWRPDDAAEVASIAERAMRQRRNVMIVAAHQAGLSYRQIGALFDIDFTTVARIVASAARVLNPPAVNSTANPLTLDPAA